MIDQTTSISVFFESSLQLSHFRGDNSYGTFLYSAKLILSENIDIRDLSLKK